MDTSPDPSRSSRRTDAELPPEIRRQLGAFYTPESEVTAMVGMLTEANLSGAILEPSGGDGAFVQGLLAAGVSPNSIEVWDINKAVRSPLKRLGVRVRIGDALAYDGSKARFNVVIGNPPYLNKQSSYIKANRSWLRKRYARVGANDTYAMFTHLAGDMLAPDGQFVFLVSDTFLTLGIHERFRDWLLTEVRLDSITLLPSDTFDASVHTAIISATKSAIPQGHQIQMFDARSDRNAKPVLVDHSAVIARPGKVFSFGGDTERLLEIITRAPKLISVLHGGLGMHTGDNERYLAVVSDSGLAARGAQSVISRAQIDGESWRAYHKRGGDKRWYGPAEHAVRWDEESRKAYGVPTTATQGRNRNGKPRPGFVLSGISSRLAARRMTLDAMWESNKAFCFFPRSPRKHPVDFFVALLNSRLYSGIARVLNHTVSLQVRDVKRLPLLPFSDEEIRELARLGSAAARWSAGGGVGDPPQQGRIDTIVDAAAARLLGDTP